MSFYVTQKWRRASKAHRKTNPLCVHCQQRGVTEPATQVDHIIPLTRGGEPFDSSNLQGLCDRCHALKTAADEGKTVRMGCDVTGRPLDIRHSWNAAN